MRTEYRALVGTFILLQTTTRVNITQIFLILSHFVAYSSYQHYIASLRFVKFLKNTNKLGISYHLDVDNTLNGHADTDHASLENRRYIYSYLFMIAGGPIFWKNSFETKIISIYLRRNVLLECHVKKVIHQKIENKLHIASYVNFLLAYVCSIKSIIY